LDGSVLNSRLTTDLHRLVRVRSSEEKENSSFFKRVLPTGEVGASSLAPDGYFEDADLGVEVLERLTAEELGVEGEERLFAELGRNVAAWILVPCVGDLGAGSLSGAEDLGEDEASLREVGGVEPPLPVSDFFSLFDEDFAGVLCFVGTSGSFALESAWESDTESMERVPLGSRPILNLYELELRASFPSISLSLERDEDERELRACLRGERASSVKVSVVSEDVMSL